MAGEYKIPDVTSGFEKVLRFLSRPGYAVRDILSGNLEGAGRQAMDMATDVLSAPLPDAISLPNTARPEDFREASDLVGGMEPGIGKTAVDIVGGVLTDPLSYISFGKAGGIRAGLPFAKGTEVLSTAKAVDPLSLVGRYGDKALKTSAEFIDTQLATRAPKAATTLEAGTPVSDLYEGAKRGVRETLGWQQLTDTERQMQNQIRGMSGIAGKSAVNQAQRIAAQMNDDEAKAIADAFDALNYDAMVAHPKTGQMVPSVMSMPLQDRVATIAAQRGLDAGKLQKITEEIAGAEGKPGFHQRIGAEVKAMGSPLKDAGPEYMMRNWDIEPTAAQKAGIEQAGKSMGTPTVAKGRELLTPEDVQSFMAEGNVMERDARRRLVERAGKQGKVYQRAAVAQSVVPGVGEIGNDEVLNAISRIAETSPDHAKMMMDLYTGLPERGGLWKMLAGANRYFKPAAVSGVVIPRIGSILRNSLGGVFQAGSTEGASALSALKRQPEILSGALSDAIEQVGGSALSKGELTNKLKEVDAAFAASNGTAASVLQNLQDPVMQEALRNGLLDGFVSTEDVIKQVVGKSSKFKSWYDMPAKAFQGVEQRLRLSQYLDLIKEGKAPAEAAKIAKEAFLDYSVSSAKNRALRDVIPFAQFTAQTIPQQAKWLSRTPAAAIAMNPLFAQNEENLVYPYMQGKVNVPLGDDEQGNPQYLTGLGMPVESLSMIPTSAADVRRNVVSMAHPLLKTAYGEVTGEDPYFGTTFGSYAGNPKLLQALGMGKESEFARQYNILAGSGMIQPIAGAVQQIGTLVDPAKSTIAAVGDFVSTGRIQSVDEDRAIQQILEEKAKSDPRVKRYISLYQTGGDEGTAQLLEELKAAKQKNRKKRQAQILESVPTSP